MTALILDVETTISNKGNPFDKTNKLVCLGVKFTDKDAHIKYEDFTKIQFAINKADLIVGFNLKFDLHWCRKVDIDISNIKVWDCQLAEFILSHQKTPYPSLNDAASKYGLSPKLDVVKLDYWDKGIDTTEIPKEVLSNYLEQDLHLTQQVYEKQLEQFETIASGLFPLFRLHCADLLVLEEMEWNGILFDTEAATTKAEELQHEINSIQASLVAELGGVPFNPNSNDHVSAALYGGTIVESTHIPVGVFKTGLKIGQTRYKIVDKEYTLPRLCEPIKGTETEKSKKAGGEPFLWEVNETVLRKLKLSKSAKSFVKLLTRYAELQKLCGTYLKGYCNLIEEQNWEPKMLHGTLNQCVAITGRLSSSKPNLQNADPQTKTYMITRY